MYKISENVFFDLAKPVGLFSCCAFWMFLNYILLNINNPHTATATILDIYLGLVEPAVGRSQSMHHLQNPVNGLAPFRVLVAQLVEHPPGVWKVMGSNPIGDSDFFPRVYVCFNYSFKT